MQSHNPLHPTSSLLQVLATDMKQHFAIVSHFTTIHRLSASESITPSATYSVRDRNRGGCA